jgi:uncharacterized protein YggE
MIAPLLHAAALSVLLSAEPPTLLLTASGEVEASATDLRITAHLETTARDLPKATEACEAQLKDVLAQLEKAGADPKEVTVVDAGSGPAYDEDGRPSRFAARRQLTVTLHRLDRGAPVAAALSKGKGLFVQLATFSIDRPDDVEIRTLAAAAQRARREGDAITAELGVKLSRVQRVQELSYVPPTPVSVAGPTVSFGAPPKLRASAQLQVIFELEGVISTPRTAANVAEGSRAPAS